MNSRRYIKRVWRVPKDRGASEYLAAIIVKSLRKHGWPASSILTDEGFNVLHYDLGLDFPADFGEAVSIACRIAARARRVEIYEESGSVAFLHHYTVSSGGHFIKSK